MGRVFGLSMFHGRVRSNHLVSLSCFRARLSAGLPSNAQIGILSVAACVRRMSQFRSVPSTNRCPMLTRARLTVNVE